MVIYNRQEKVIIIPDCGCSSVSGSGHSRCEREVQIAYTSGWSGGYEQGLEDCSGSTCNLTTGELDLNNGDSGRWIVYPDEEYDGFDQFRVYDRGYGEGKYQEGYEAGLQDCSGHTDCTSAITEAYQSGWTEGYNSASTKEIELRFYFDGFTLPPGIYNKYNKIAINGVEAQLTYFEETSNFDQYDAHFLTSEQSASTIELWIDYQNNGGYVVNPVPEFLAIKEYDAFNIPIISQSMEYVGEPEAYHKVYKYTFTVQNTPFYDKESFEAGLAACQNNE